MRRVLILSLAAFTALAVVLTVTGVILYRAVQHEPQFYRAALHGDRQKQQAAGDEFEQRLLALRNDSRHAGLWQMVLTDEQINGWLAHDLPEKFPDVVPQGIRDPRVAIGPRSAQVALRYEQGDFQTVISLVLELHLALEPNTLAIRIRQVRAGSLPVPRTQFLERVTSIARDAAVPLRWSQIEGDPVGLVTVPHRLGHPTDRTLFLETLELRDGEICLVGHTEQSEPAQLSQESPAGYRDENVTVQR